MRCDGREGGQLREVKLVRKFTRFAEGSVLTQIGDTWVLCTASVEERVPPFLRGTGKGWVTSEFRMLPRATDVRSARDEGGRVSGRVLEIQRLIGRSLRAVTRLDLLSERTITIDCDVLQADGGTRTAAITGGFVALVDALRLIAGDMGWSRLPISSFVAATSVGVLDGGLEVVDLCYDEDVRALVDMNVVMADDGRLVEIQGTAEGFPFGREQLDRLLDLAGDGIRELIRVQTDVLGDVGPIEGE